MAQFIDCRMIRLLWLAVTIVATTAMSARPPEASTTQPLSAPGSITSHMGRVVNTDQVAGIILTHNNLDFGKNICNYVTHAVHNLTASLKNQTRSEYSLCANKLPVNETEKCDSIYKTYNLVHAELDAILKFAYQKFSFQDRDKMTVHRREKRSFFAGIGEFFHAAIGVATDRQIEDVQTQLNEISITNRINIDNFRHIKDAWTSLKSTVSSITHEINKIKIDESHTKIIQDITIKCDLIRQTINNKADAMNNIATLIAGHVTPASLPPLTLTEILTNMTNSTPIPFTTILDYYPFLKASVFPNFTIIQIPLLPTNKKIHHLYQVIPLPSTNPITFPYATPFFYIKENNPNSIADPYYVENTDLIECSSNRHTYVCTNIQTIKITDESFPCQASLLNGQTTHCKYFASDDTRPRTYKTNQAKYIFLFNDTKVTTKCGFHRAQERLLKGLYQIRQNCDIKAENFHFSPIKQFTLATFGLYANEHQDPEVLINPLKRTDLADFKVMDIQIDDDDDDAHTRTVLTVASITPPVIIVINAIITFGMIKFMIHKYTRNSPKSTNLKITIAGPNETKKKKKTKSIPLKTEEKKQVTNEDVTKQSDTSEIATND